jgi:hypothetical protein
LTTPKEVLQKDLHAVIISYSNAGNRWKRREKKKDGRREGLVPMIIRLARLGSVKHNLEFIEIFSVFIALCITY